MRIKYGLVNAALVICSTSAQAMNADTLYLKATALQKKGKGAMLSSDLKVVMSEFESSMKSVKAENDAAKAAGNPIYCPPAKRNKMSSSQLIEEFGKIPTAQRKAMTVKAAWRSILIKKYPC